MNHAFYSAESYRRVQKSPFRDSIVLKIKDNKIGILKADAINAIYTLLHSHKYIFLNMWASFIIKQIHIQHVIF